MMKLKEVSKNSRTCSGSVDRIGQRWNKTSTRPAPTPLTRSSEPTASLRTACLPVPLTLSLLRCSGMLNWPAAPSSPEPQHWRVQLSNVVENRLWDAVMSFLSSLFSEKIEYNSTADACSAPLLQRKK